MYYDGSSLAPCDVRWDTRKSSINWPGSISFCPRFKPHAILLGRPENADSLSSMVCIYVHVYVNLSDLFTLNIHNRHAYRWTSVTNVSLIGLIITKLTQTVKSHDLVNIIETIQIIQNSLFCVQSRTHGTSYYSNHII